MTMATVLESLQGINAYPVPLKALEDAALLRGVTLTQQATQEIMLSAAYRLARADILMWLALAPNVSQGGQTYGFSEDQRTQFRSQALAIYAELGNTTKPTYGYKGSRL